MFGRLFGRKTETPTITLAPSGRVIEAPKGATILGAALKAGVDYPSNCRVGSCGACKSRLVEGEIRALTDFSYTLSADELSAGCILACQAVPKGPVVVQPLAVADSTVAGRILRQDGLTHDIQDITLALDSTIDFKAGQYATLSVPGVAEGRCYSFAHAPQGDGTARFIIRHVPGGAFTGWLFGGDRAGTAISLGQPRGDFGLKAPGPGLFIAGGSGLGPVLSVLETLAAAGDRRKLTLLFGARTAADLYARDRLDALSRQLDLTVRFILSAEPAGSDWAGERGLVTAPLAEMPLPAAAALCGPPAMIDAAIAVLRGRGLAPAAISFDKFTDQSSGGQSSGAQRPAA
ncbi:2Fe-2S iron-sulfur cluster-binding protein [Zavarzinia compransoris]|uniref:Oxidoreductase n=1 Tax=Zavarzinia compransoris TaxID=1264899 RepID=A0A317E581_9PROT|nr:2Fe-2S iron-sulfur cluster binding domain-containing protein [Zavarzinia compransoris]PWR21732.1 hypothetical protein DKG75_06970 [Zavarzinia compransoris]TDP45480.1 NAD(P)H-flavin reductase [Zavarzinia compransoris]